MANWDILVDSARLNNSIMQYLRNTGTSLEMDSQSDMLFHTAGNTNASFCSSDNIQSCVCLLNQELQVLGFPVIQEDLDVVMILNNLHDILRLYQRSVRDREELTDRLHKTIAEKDHFQSKTKRLREEIETLDRNVAREQELKRQLTIQNKTMSQKLKKEKDEVKKLQSFIHRESQQASHRVKKLERQVVKLSDRLHDQMSEKNPLRKFGIGIANPIRTDGRRSTWKTGQNKQELELHQQIVSKYEERQQNLCVEIAELRDCLVSMERELLSVLNRSDNPFRLHSPQNRLGDVSTSTDEEPDDNALPNNSPICLDDLQPMDERCKYTESGHRDIEKRIKKTCNLLKQKMISSQQNGITNASCVMDTTSMQQSPPRTQQRSGSVSKETDRRSGERDKLCSQIQQYKEIIRQQEQLIQQSLRNQSQSVETSFLHESHLHGEKESLTEEKRSLLQEKANFEEERRTFSEVAATLGKEKERVELFMEQYKNLDAYSASDDSAFESLHHGSSHRVRMLPATPVYSHSCRTKTPTTSELYRSLGITPCTSSAVKKLRKATSDESVMAAVSRKSSTSSRNSMPSDCTSSRHSMPSDFTSCVSSSLQMDAMKRALFQSASKVTGRSDFNDNGS
ncbi:afadin- and alpha-actinin-binding protein A-like [Gigantopelta aegis]|uniref:afadin- and alpha-actinin-binding protein A-like n=1 Tax=Gigantopelta aegis TaxID=1735272 RepID=UPI001B88E6BC|nr:afadin- and alpha-actinin-binding protein A-like [Gigantopelta aegis]